MDIVKVRNLTKRYAEITAVNNISFSIKKGEIFGFLGPNGAGKTTTLKMLVGLARPTAGQIIIDGIDAVRAIKQVQDIMGVVSDENNLYDEMSGFENLCFCAALYGMPRAQREKRARELLQKLNLTAAAQRPFRTYSRGMKRKLTIAAALIHKPKLIFLDEPTTGIDLESARLIRRLLKKLKEQGRTIMITTHYLEEAERLCDRAAFIVKGRIVQSGRMAQLIKDSAAENKIKLILDGDLEMAPVLQFFAAQGIRVHGVEEVTPTLEEVFLKITNTERGGDN
ncbi:MAG: ABC transporter ATP-binding protein [Firmicutes bacterium]|nr:ABC transporter ATP-binding protein [Bacillota bacterium]